MLTKNTDQLKQRVAEHVAADSVVQGIYWDEEALRGCFIGCLAHGDYPRINEAAYGLPVMLQRIAENIFEELPIAEAKAFFAALPDAVGCDGKDLTRVCWQFLAAELRSLPAEPEHIQAVIDPVIAGMDKLASGQEWSRSAAKAAESAAWAATWSAESAAWAASGGPYVAAYAVRSAAYAAEAADDGFAHAVARAATWSAESAAGAAGGGPYAAAARLRQRDLLLQLISEAPVVEQLDD